MLKAWSCTLRYSIMVSHSTHSHYQGGRTWTITFQDTINPGDIEPLQVDTGGLTGIGAGHLVQELVKGSEAVGTSAWVSFEAPYYCSTTETTPGECGDAVDQYTIEWDTASDFTSRPKTATLDDDGLLRDVQIVTTESRTGATMSGTFQLAYGGDVSPPIDAHASAVAVRDAIEAMDAVDTVNVKRDYAAIEIEGTVDITFGGHFIQCTAGGPCGLAELEPCDLIYLGGEWFRIKVRASYLFFPRRRF